jgi:nicotinate-nucleotide adenylyltransferase
MSRIGMYGGAFDPPHLAHLALARAAIEQYRLDRLLIIPTGLAAHKKRSLSPAQHRLALARLAFSELPQAEIDPRETVRSGASYTIDTLTELRSEHPAAELFLLMGQDQLQQFASWKQAEDILSIATLLVAFRADSMPGTEHFSSEKQVKIDSLAASAPAHLPIQMSASSISASAIRQRRRDGQTIEHLVNPPVARYIAEHQLYLPS